MYIERLNCINKLRNTIDGLNSCLKIIHMCVKILGIHKDCIIHIP